MLIPIALVRPVSTHSILGVIGQFMKLSGLEKVPENIYVGKLE